MAYLLRQFLHPPVLLFAAGADLAQLVVEQQDAVRLGTLDDGQPVLVEAVVAHLALGLAYGGIAKLASHGNHAQRQVLLVDIGRNHLRACLRELAFDKAADVAVENALFHDVGGDDGCGNHRHDDHRCDYLAHAAFAFGGEEDLLLEVHQLDATQGGQADEDGVDKEEVKGSKKVHYVACAEAETGRAQRRHQGRGDGHAGDDVALAFGAEGNDARRAAAEGYQHIVERR